MWCARSDLGGKAEAWRGLTWTPNATAVTLAAGSGTERSHCLGAISDLFQSGAPRDLASSSEVSGCSWLWRVLVIPEKCNLRITGPHNPPVRRACSPVLRDTLHLPFPQEQQQQPHRSEVTGLGKTQRLLCSFRGARKEHSPPLCGCKQTASRLCRDQPRSSPRWHEAGDEAWFELKFDPGP